WSPSNVLERLTYLFSGQGRYLIRGDGDRPVAAALQAHFDRSDFNLESPVPHHEIEHMAGLYAELIAQRLWHDDPPRRVDGGSHCTNLPRRAITMSGERADLAGPTAFGAK